MISAGTSIDDASTVRSGTEDQPLLVLLHGYGSHEQDLSGLVPHLPGELATASLRAPLTLAPGSYAWVPVRVPGKPEPAIVAASAEALLDWLDKQIAPERRVSLLGFSQGGLMVTQLMRLRPERFASGVVLSGFVLEGELTGDEGLAKRRPPVFFGHGDADPVIAPSATERTYAWLPRHSTLEHHEYAGLAHGISAEELADVSAFLRANAL